MGKTSASEGPIYQLFSLSLVEWMEPLSSLVNLICDKEMIFFSEHSIKISKTSNSLRA